MHMNGWSKGSQACVVVLMLLAALTTALLCLEKTAWPVIIAYWVVLTGKNLCDWLALNARKGEDE